MSLQVWLPLNGDLHNQGLANINLNYNPTFANSGKIGNQCLNSQIGWFAVPTMAGKKQMSFAYWVKINTGTSTNWLDTFSWYSTNGSSDYRCRQEFYYYNRGVNTEAMTTGVWYYNTSNSELTQRNIGEWYHYTFTINYDTGITQFFVNGTLWKTTTNANTSHYIKGTHFLLRQSTLDCQINDFRLYDHCLSNKEVEEISKGLVLHYKLDGEGRGQENLFIGSGMTSTDIANLVATSNKTWTKYLRYYNGSASIHSFSNGVDTIKLNQAANLGISFVRKATDISLDSTSYYTISCLAKCNKAGAGLDIGLSYYNTSNAWVWRGGTNRQLFNSTTDWQYFTLTFKPDSNTQYICYCFTVYGVKNGTNTFSICNCKLEKGSVATPYELNSADANFINLKDNIINDASGYNNNGSLLGSPIINQDVTRYGLSTYFDGNDDGILIENLELSNIINNQATYSFWIKPSGEDGARSIYFGSYSETSWSIEKTAGNILRSYWNGSPDTTCTGATIIDGIWQHICIVKNGTADLKIYINGILKFSSTATLSAKTFPTTYRIGRDTRTGATSYKGLMSDFRIYATALTENQVLDLYHTSAIIDNKGNIYTREFDENKNLNLTKTGIFNSNSISDDNDLTKASILKATKQLQSNTLYEY